MEEKISVIIISISILTSMLFGIDRITSENPSDSATLRISLSDRDSSYCDECTEGGIFYESGCKRCVQDGIMFGVGSIEQIEYNVGWSNNDAMYHGDKNCEGNWGEYQSCDKTCGGGTQMRSFVILKHAKYGASR